MAGLDLGEQLEEGRTRRVLARLAPKVRNHQHLSTLLTTAPLHLRQTIYETLRPNLHFKALPLDRYIAQAGARAEREQWPILEENGQLREFRPTQDLSSLERQAQAALGKELAEQILTMTCSKCTFQQSFHKIGQETSVDVILKARRAGWIYDYLADPPREICPTCPTSLRANA